MGRQTGESRPGRGICDSRGRGDRIVPGDELTGFSMHTDVTAEICQPDAEIQSRAQMDSTPDMTNQPTTGWTIEQVSSLARRHHKTIGIGWVKKNRTTL